MTELGCWIIGVGLAFDLFGCIGLARLPDVYNRCQAATKCVTLGTCAMLVGTGLALVGQSGGLVLIKAVLCTVFILLTSPAAAHAICRGAYLAGVPLWEGSVEDGFADRARQIRGQPAGGEGMVSGEKAENP